MYDQAATPIPVEAYYRSLVEYLVSFGIHPFSAETNTGKPFMSVAYSHVPLLRGAPQYAYDSAGLVGIYIA
jgi:hypothetical protein